MDRQIGGVHGVEGNRVYTDSLEGKPGKPDRELGSVYEAPVLADVFSVGPSRQNYEL